jgi:glutamate/aspartate transport system substrate-binding protein
MNRWLSVLFFAAILTSPAFGQSQGTLEKVKATKTMAIGYREASLPFSFLGDDGKPTGYSIELCTLIAMLISLTSHTA